MCGLQRVDLTEISGLTYEGNTSAYSLNPQIDKAVDLIQKDLLSDLGTLASVQKHKFDNILG
ncbi:hypothetical protein [Parachlamydia acanthamoebae]|uniref:hypothetical protein n=1 Tax=Parachlamydia acanthamoebae TaxID=83552 RepID=UPI000751848A|nr:hypothetical protein [Parachlamydia acanthamoebae]